VPALRLALAQVNATVGAIDANADLVVEWTRRAAEAGADLVAFPEMVLTGYPVEDLALRASFVAASRSVLAGLPGRLVDAGLGHVTVVAGYLDRLAGSAAEPVLGRPSGAPQNAFAVLHGGRVVARGAKHHLPNYGVFDEIRYFVPGDTLDIVTVRGADVAVVVCEDLWQEGGPVSVARHAGSDLLLVLNGSPYEAAKDDRRAALCRLRAADAGCPLAYVNLVGGQDELVFDGDSLVVTPDGRLLARAPQFVEHLLVVDLDLPGGTGPVAPGPSTLTATEGIRVERAVVSGADADQAPAGQPASGHIAEPLDPLAEIYHALVIGLRDYVRKNGFPSVTLGLSGGIDSALVAVLAADAVGAENVVGVSMPSRYSSEHSRDDAADLARRVGLQYRSVPIAPMVAAFLESLALTGLAEENLQARVRGVVLMGLSNQEGHLVLATGNKSELAVGYSTIYGDAVGGYAPIKDVPKTLVWELARWRNAEAERRGEQPPIPVSSIDKPPSAELRPDQKDTDSLPEYQLLDDLLDDYVEQDRGSTELVAAGFEPALVERVIRMVDRAEYKRRQFPPGTKISTRNFGRDRRLPITSAWREPPVAGG
jgi:NAD+ synthase (glutamine-hydrolysing)